MNILAIETSCDDTAIAVVEAEKGKFKILSNIVSSQVKLHQKYGGVFPTLAKREHQKNLPKVLDKALAEAKNPELDLVAVTAGPGLEPCLWTGINFAKELTKKKGLPLVPVNHIEAHILVSLLNQKGGNLFPAIALIVSGGHTQLILMKDFGKYQIIGETRDDAAGECFDKVARILGLSYPGGPEIAKEAEKHKGKLKPDLPRPMIHQKNYDFSFSGLKTAVLYDFKNQSKTKRKSKEYIQAMAAETQQAIIDVLIQKTIKAGKNKKAKTIILGGGVTANKELRKQLKKRAKKEKIKLFIPETKYSTDNAVMTAITAFYLWQKKKTWKDIKANANLKIDEKL